MDRNKNNVWLAIAGFIILAIGFQSGALAAASPAGADLSRKARLVETYGKLPLSFEVNQGQTGEQVKFLSRGPGYSVFLTPTEAVLALRKAVANKAETSKNPVIPGKTEGRDPESKAIQKNRDWMPASAGMTRSRIDADHKPAQTATLRERTRNRGYQVLMRFRARSTTSAATTRRNGAPTSRPTPRSSMKTSTLASISSTTATSSNWNTTSWLQRGQILKPFGSLLPVQRRS